MATKVKVLVQTGLVEADAKKPIKAIKSLQSNCTIYEYPDGLDLSVYEHIVLICKNYTSDGLDLMYLHDGNPDSNPHLLFLGHFNDGIV